MQGHFEYMTAITSLTIKGIRVKKQNNEQF
jgi:hypothetical protein